MKKKKKSVIKKKKRRMMAKRRANELRNQPPLTESLLVDEESYLDKAIYRAVNTIMK